MVARKTRRRKTVAVLFIGGRSQDAHDREIMARRGKERKEGDEVKEKEGEGRGSIGSIGTQGRTDSDRS